MIAAGSIWYGLKSENEFTAFVAAAIFCLGLASYISFQNGIKRRGDPVIFAIPFLIPMIIELIDAQEKPNEIISFWILTTVVALGLNFLSDELVFRTIIEDQENT